MLLIAVLVLVLSAAIAYLIGAAFVAPRDSFWRSKTGILALIVLGLSFVTLPPQMPMLQGITGALGAAGSAFPMDLSWPSALPAGLYDGIWVVTSLAAFLAGYRVWESKTNKAYDASAASRVSSMLPLADTLPDALDVLARAGLSPKDVARSAADIRLAGSRLANSLPPSDGALYTMVVAKVPASIAASVTGYLLEGAGRRSQQ
jgi:hypothetical protein